MRAELLSERDLLGVIYEGRRGAEGALGLEALRRGGDDHVVVGVDALHGDTPVGGIDLDLGRTWRTCSGWVARLVDRQSPGADTDPAASVDGN